MSKQPHLHSSPQLPAPPGSPKHLLLPGEAEAPWLAPKDLLGCAEPCLSTAGGQQHQAAHATPQLLIMGIKSSAEDNSSGGAVLSAAAADETNGQLSMGTRQRSK